MIVISTREFRQNQRIYLNKAKNGEDIVLKSRENGSFKLVPVTEKDTLIEKDYILKPDADLDNALTAEQFKTKAKKHIKELYSQNNK